MSEVPHEQDPSPGVAAPKLGDAQKKLQDVPDPFSANIAKEEQPAVQQLKSLFGGEQHMYL